MKNIKIVEEEIEVNTNRGSGLSFSGLSLAERNIERYRTMWLKLKEWVKKEEVDMLTDPHRTELYYSGIACQTSYIKGKIEELEKEQL
jgi:hypothetical protein